MPRYWFDRLLPGQTITRQFFFCTCSRRVFLNANIKNILIDCNIIVLFSHPQFAESGLKTRRNFRNIAQFQCVSSLF